MSAEGETARRPAAAAAAPLRMSVRCENGVLIAQRRYSPLLLSPAAANSVGAAAMHRAPAGGALQERGSLLDMEQSTSLVETSLDRQPLCAGDNGEGGRRERQGNSAGGGGGCGNAVYGAQKSQAGGPTAGAVVVEPSSHGHHESMESAFRLPLRIMRCVGFVWSPHILGAEPKACTALSLLWSLALLAVNFGMMCLVMGSVHQSRLDKGMLHPGTMADLLTGMKPLRNCFNLLLFITMQGAHTHFIRSMQRLDADFYESFGVHADWRHGTRVFCACVFVAFMVPFLSRVIELGLVLPTMPLAEMPFDFNMFMMLVASPVLAPMLSVWQLSPLFYFVVFTRTLRHWLCALRGSMKRDQALGAHDSDFYYRYFMQITNCVRALNDFFHMYLFFAVGLSVMILCLAIYFVINAPKVLETAEGMSDAEVLVQYFYPAWAGIQVLVAAAYVVCIAIAGLKLNEVARSVGGVVLNLRCRTEHDRFNVIRFMHRVQSQHPAWGVSIWRALPIERSLLFTIFGMISTYAVLLLKLQKDQQRDDIVTACSVLPTVMSRLAQQAGGNDTLAALGAAAAAAQHHQRQHDGSAL